MACYHPLKGFRSKTPSASGKYPIVFNRSYGYLDLPVTVPCGQCVGCRLERSRQWAIRCMHEAKLYACNSFVTLTYAPEHLPPDCSLDVREFQLFMKRLRKRFKGLSPVIDHETGETTYPIRFYHCGEYGDTHGRPHYHVLLFNFDFEDKYYWKTTKAGHRLYRSEALEELWTYGHAYIGDVTFESAAYVARYIMKKVNGENAESHYTRYDPFTGEITQLKPEYTTMSRRPGIGARWLDKFLTDVYPHDYVVIRDGKKVKPPKFYDTRYEYLYPEDHAKLKNKRVSDAKKHVDNNTADRLYVREQVKLAQITKLKRNLDNEI